MYTVDIDTNVCVVIATVTVTVTVEMFSLALGKLIGTIESPGGGACRVNVVTGFNEFELILGICRPPDDPAPDAPAPLT
jgi:hypothetical protein